MQTMQKALSYRNISLLSLHSLCKDFLHSPIYVILPPPSHHLCLEVAYFTLLYLCKRPRFRVGLTSTPPTRVTPFFRKKIKNRTGHRPFNTKIPVRSGFPPRPDHLRPEPPPLGVSDDLGPGRFQTLPPARPMTTLDGVSWHDNPAGRVLSEIPPPTTAPGVSGHGQDGPSTTAPPWTRRQRTASRVVSQGSHRQRPTSRPGAPPCPAKPSHRPEIERRHC